MKKIYFNAPIILSYIFICTIALVIDFVTAGWLTTNYLSVYSSSISFDSVIRLFGHVFGHADMNHLYSNSLMLLLLGPMLEEKYGKQDLCVLIAATAVATGLVHILVAPGVGLLGASGVVCAFIVCASIVNLKEGGIPLTALFVAIIYFGQEVYTSIFVVDNVSQLAHIVGGLVGALLGPHLGKEE